MSDRLLQHMYFFPSLEHLTFLSNVHYFLRVYEQLASVLCMKVQLYMYHGSVRTCRSLCVSLRVYSLIRFSMGKTVIQLVSIEIQSDIFRSQNSVQESLTNRFRSIRICPNTNLFFLRVRDRKFNSVAFSVNPTHGRVTGQMFD